MTFTRSSQRRPALPEKSSAAGHALAAQRMESKGKGPFPLVKDIVGYLKMCHSILPIKR